MENIEQIFKKVNNDRIELKDHKNKLKSVLMNSKYFKEEESGWDWKLTVSSLSFSSLLIVFAYIHPVAYNNNQQVAGANDAKGGFYNTLISSKNASPSEGEWNNQEVKIIQTVEENSRAVYYFNKQNVLVNSQVIRNNK